MRLSNPFPTPGVSIIAARVTAGVSAVLFSALTSGCASMMTSPTQWFEKEPEFVTPNKVIPVWSDTVLHQAGQPGIRGCGGRVMFYAGDGKRASRVDGTLVVYAWDDSKASADRQPDRKFVFPADDLQQHYSASTIGDSYSFWLPWDQAGGERKELTLVARFIGKNGAEITSTPTKVILPGDVPLPAQQATGRPLVIGSHHRIQSDNQVGSIQQTAFEVISDTETVRQTNYELKTAEIPLTEGFLQRNMQNAGSRAFSSDDLFQESDSPKRPFDSKAGEWPKMSSSGNPSAANGDSATDSASEIDSRQPATERDSAPAGRSLRFQDRVRTSREAQRSVDHALSERYQSGSRSAPWQKD